MLIDRDTPEDVFARVPELAAQTDPVLRALDLLLEDGPLCQQVRADFARRYPKTTCHGRPFTPVEALLRLLAIQHLFDWSYGETVRRVADSPVLRWFCRVYFQRVPHASTLERWAALMRPDTLDHYTAARDAPGPADVPSAGAAQGRGGGPGPHSNPRGAPLGGVHIRRTKLTVS